MRPRFAVWLRRTGWQLVLAVLGFVQVAGTFTAYAQSLYLVKWLAGVGIAVCYFLLGRCHVSRKLATEYAMLFAVLAIGLVTQLGDSIDGRAIALVISYTLTGTTAFLVAPAAFRRRAVHRTVWPALLAGVAAGTLYAEYLGLQDFLSAITTSSGRLRFFGAFYQPNAAGTAGLIGVILAVAALEARRRWWYLLTLPFFFVVMILADSRGSILAALTFLLSLPILRMTRWPPRRIAMAFTLGAIVLLVGGVYVAGKIHWPVTGQWQPELNRISTGRLTNWSESLGYLESPLRWMFGLGLSRNFSFTYQETDFPVPVRGSNADNFFIDILGRTGIVGLLLMLGIIASLTLKMWRGLTFGSPRIASQCTLGLALLISTVLLGATNSVIFTWAWLQAIVGWPLIGAAATHSDDSYARTVPMSPAPLAESGPRRP